MPDETYPCYVRISAGPESEEVIELPTEADGKLVMTTITAQFPDAIGLRFKSDSGAWRGMRFIDGALEPPIEGWGYNDYFITTGTVSAAPKKAEKRKLESDGGPASSRSKQDLLQDLIVLGLPYSATEDDLKTYFEKFGELDHHELKMDQATKRSKGFGFIRFKTEEAAQAALDAEHTLGGRSLDVKFPYKSSGMFQDNNPTKLFVGRLPSGTTTEQLREHFQEYGPLKDVYIPKNFRGFGFVTFGSRSAANQALGETHQLNGSYLNLTFPQPKQDEAAAAQPQKFVFDASMVPQAVSAAMAQYMIPQTTRGGGASARGGYYAASPYAPQYQQPYRDPHRGDNGNWKR